MNPQIYKKIKLILILFSFGLGGTTYTSIPFIFYRPERVPVDINLSQNNQDHIFIDP